MRPADFGQEDVTAIIDGKEVTFSRHIGVKSVGQAGEDETIYISSRLFKALSDVVNDKTLCSPETQASGADTASGSQSLGSKITNSSTSDMYALNTNNKRNGSQISTRDEKLGYLEDMILEPCAKSIMDYITESMTPDSAFFDIFPATENAKIAREFVDHSVEEVTQHATVQLEAITTVATGIVGLTVISFERVHLFG